MSGGYFFNDSDDDDEDEWVRCVADQMEYVEVVEEPNQWAAIYRLKYQKRQCVEHAIHSKHVHEFKTFQWTVLDFANSKKLMMRNFSPICGNLRHVYSIEWEYITEIYDEYEPVGDLFSAEYTVYNMLFQQGKWTIIVEENIREIFAGDPLPLNVWSECIAHTALFVNICRHLDCKSIRTFAQTSRATRRAFASSRRHIKDVCFPAGYKHYNEVCGIVIKNK